MRLRALRDFADEYPVISLLPFCPAPNTSPMYVPTESGSEALSRLECHHHPLDGFVTSSEHLDMVNHVQHAELAVRDLIAMVKSSNLTAKDALAHSLTEFMEGSRAAARDLQMFSSKLHGTVNSISAFNAYMNQAMESSGLIGNAGSVNGLDDAGEVSIQQEALEVYLTNVHSLCLQEEFETAGALDDLLWQLWTHLSGNRHKMRDLKHRESVLKSLRQYRVLAATYVANALHGLTAVDSQLSDLRDRLSDASPSGAAEIPITVHLDGIDRSLARLKGRLGMEEEQTHAAKEVRVLEEKNSD
ncbi:hypothetical protein L226DRAFT_547844 [Lentinus tigrinus ALCF2SS1-7]|uniref:uncharacterized protein n=1 Tax=Lentinus tigrinus ALCF2SS1-7 TaxID=1328758 RepID=UPI001165F6C5|nr:hypothetical protein L226DRAFT_547844 [Lentinus tigrinus ALCF2SS1-7]